MPFVPQWRLSSLPRYLSVADVERLIASCDLDTAHGVRDRAILLLFARLGLRVGDVRNMRLDDIDWVAGTVLVSGKGHREVRLPLPRTPATHCSPISKSDRSSMKCGCSCARARHIGRSAVPPRSHAWLAWHCIAPGSRIPPSRGGNLLRHSAATAMLRGGATLQSVGAVLRHRSLDTTAHYAKVDLPMLQQITQPWPGERSC